MFHRSAEIPLAERTVGVVHRKDGVQEGFVLFSCAKETYLVDEDGRAVHEWVSGFFVFAAYLLESGNLLRDGSENLEAPAFQQGGAAGYVEEVTWENELLWCYECLPLNQFLSHHTMEPMPNGNVLISVWDRKSKREVIQRGRRPEFIADGEVWNNLILELKPNRQSKAAEVVWKWSMFDHLVQDFDDNQVDFGNVLQSFRRFDFNACPNGGKNGQRNQLLVDPKMKKPQGEERKLAVNASGKTGEKDWLHMNSLGYDPVRDQIVCSINTQSEIIIIDHSTTTEEARSGLGGRYGHGGNFLFRWGNPKIYRRGTAKDQKLFMQHSVSFIPQNCPGAGNLLVFNNGRVPDRQFSTIDEIILPEETFMSGIYISPKEDDSNTFLPEDFSWSFGEKFGKAASFYCTHVSSCQRLPNGNTLILQGPQGIIIEVTPDGTEVWRYISPVVANKSIAKEGIVSFLRQGSLPTDDTSRLLFIAMKYTRSFPGLQDKYLKPYRYLEA